MRTLTRLLALGIMTVTGLSLLPAPPARALVDLQWQPQCQSLQPGEILLVGLYARSDSGSNHPMSAMDVILNWDPALLQLVGVLDNGPYDWLFSGFSNDAGLDGLNDTWLDGDALYSAYAQLGQPAYATPAGLLVTTLRFQVQAATEVTLLGIPAHAGSFSHTRVFDGVIPGLDVHGLLGNTVASIGFTGPIYCSLACQPATGTIPFSTQITAVLGSNYTDQHRRVAGRLDLRMADGTSYSYFRAGYTNLYPGECLYTTWTQDVPALPSLVGENVLVLHALDVTPSPYNQPPHAPSGGTDTDSCTVIGSAP